MVRGIAQRRTEGIKGSEGKLRPRLSLRKKKGVTNLPRMKIAAPRWDNRNQKTLVGSPEHRGPKGTPKGNRRRGGGKKRNCHEWSGRTPEGGAPRETKKRSGATVKDEGRV